MTASTNSATPLPPIYRKSLDGLLAADPPLSSLTDASVLDLVKEILSSLGASIHTYSDDWARNEADLLHLDGYVKDSSVAFSRYQVGSLAHDYLNTYMDALQWKMNKDEKKKPELLSKKRQVDGCDVYGPVKLSSLLPGNTFEAWTLPMAASKENIHDSDTNPKQEVDSQTLSNADTTPGPITVILGAGNQSFLTLIDTLDNVLRHRRPVLVKHHPLRPWLLEMYDNLLIPLTRRGYLAQVLDDSVAVTTALLSDPAVGHVHVTGSFQTARAIRETLHSAHPHWSEEMIQSMVTSELGCATPMIVDDGEYTDAELRHMAQIIVAGKKTNGGCNCLSAQVVVLPKQWEQKYALRSILVEELKRQPTLPCYYPGSVERTAAMVAQCQEFGSNCEVVEASSTLDGIKVNKTDEVVLVECGTPGEESYNSTPLLSEAFGPLLAIVELDGEKANDYLTNVAVPFVNNKSNIFGSLSCSIFTPLSRGDLNRVSLEPVLAALQYGSININQFNALGYFTACRGGIWGGHPAEKLGQSGRGHIGNQYGISNIAKVVVYGPSLTNKPSFETNPVPPVIADILRELTLAPSVFRGFVRVVMIVLPKSFFGLLYRQFFK